MTTSHAVSLSQRSLQSLRTGTLMLPLAASVYCMGLAPDVRAQPMQYIEQSQIRAQPQAAFTQEDLDQMLAPIALYPDSLLSQILMASTYPLEVVQAARWSRAHPGLSGDDAVRDVANQDWDPSVKSMTAFPQILSMMDERLDWTQRLGDAFLDREPHVMETVQGLRQRAYAAGNLNSDGQVRVVRQERIILVQPVNPQVVYLPYYDPTVIYGSWWWPAPPVYWRPWAGYAPAHVRQGVRVGFYWGRGVSISAGYFFGQPDWQRRNVNVVHVNNYYHHHTVVNRGPDRSHVGPARWRHDPSHRGSIPYRDPAVHERFAAQQRQAVEQHGHRRHEPRHEPRAEVRRGPEARHERDRDGRGWDGRADNGYGNRNRPAVTAPAAAVVQPQAAAPQRQEARLDVAAAAQRGHVQEQRQVRQRDINREGGGNRNAERNFSRRDDHRDDGRRDGRGDARPERGGGARSDAAPAVRPPAQRPDQAQAQQRRQAEESQRQQQQVQQQAEQVQRQQQAERVRREQQQRHTEQVQRQHQQLQAEQVRQQQQVQQRQQQEARREETRRDARPAGGQRDERVEGRGRGEGRNRLSTS